MELSNELFTSRESLHFSRYEHFNKTLSSFLQIENISIDIEYIKNFFESQRYDQSLEHLLALYEKNSDKEQIIYLLAYNYLQLDQCIQAAKIIQNAFSTCQVSNKTLLLYAYALYKRKEFEKAALLLERLLNDQEISDEASLYLGSLYLLQKNFQEGWPIYAKVFHKSSKQWDGSPLEKKTLLVDAGSDLSTAILLCRYFALIHQEAPKANLLFLIPQEYLHIFSNLPNYVQVITGLTGAAYYDYITSIYALPYLCASTSLLTSSAYLSYSKEISPHCKLHAQIDHKKIGILWFAESNTPYEPNLYYPIEKFLPLLDHPTCSFYSLQTGKYVEEIKNIENIVDLSSLMIDWENTVQVIHQLDLLICVDSPLAHLASAMGKPVWLLSSEVPDWKWTNEQEKSLWYPTVTIFKDKKYCGRHSIFDQIHRSLKFFSIPKNLTVCTNKGNISWEGANPEDIKYIHNRVADFLRENDFDSALQIASVLRKVYPESTHTQFMMALIHQGKKEHLEALKYLNAVIVYEPENIEVICALSATLHYLKRYREAENLLRNSIEKNLTDKRFFNDLGLCIEFQGRYQEALEWYQQGKQIDPDTYNLEFKEAICLLTLGRFEEGFKKYESRFEVFKEKLVLDPLESHKYWKGEDISAKTIIVYMEQGFGDQIQFIRYITYLKLKGAKKIYIKVVGDTVPLFCAFHNIATFIPSVEGIEYDYWVLLMSLPYLFGTTIDTVPKLQNYIAFLPGSLANFNFPSGYKKKIGFVWAGATCFVRDSLRSSNLAAYSQLFFHTDCLFCSLQLKEHEQLKEYSHCPNLLDMSPYIQSWRDTAEIISQLDLVIAVDTGIAHLAAAQGVPVWLMNSKITDWRWLLDREDSIWYPSMRIFRQKQLDDWSELLVRVSQELHIFKNS